MRVRVDHDGSFFSFFVNVGVRIVSPANAVLIASEGGPDSSFSSSFSSGHAWFHSQFPFRQHAGNGPRKRKKGRHFIDKNGGGCVGASLPLSLLYFNNFAICLAFSNVKGLKELKLHFHAPPATFLSVAYFGRVRGAQPEVTNSFS